MTGSPYVHGFLSEEYKRINTNQSLGGAQDKLIKTQFNLSLLLCLLLSLVQMPAPVRDVEITSSYHSAHVRWTPDLMQPNSSYITQITIYLDGSQYQNISRESSQFNFTGLKPNNTYTVGIQTADGSQKSQIVSKNFTTNEISKPMRNSLSQF